MKKLYGILACASVAVLVASGCRDSSDGQNRGFHPEDRTTSNMSAGEREAAIEAKRASILPVSVDSLLAVHKVKFSVLQPAVTENVPSAAGEKLASKLIQISSQNGIGGLCTNPVLAMVSRVDCVQRELTGSAPQKAIVKYEVTTYCGNLATNDIYASSVQTLTGVGTTFEDAASRAMNELKNNEDIQRMLATASDRAIEWYSKTSNVQNFVNTAVANRNYALAMALLSSVPEQASATFAYAAQRNKEVSDMFFEDKAAELLGELEGAIAAAGEDYHPELGAYLSVIPVRSSSYARAKQVYDNYLSHVADVKREERDKAHQLALEELEVEKIKAPYEAQATIEQIRADARIGVAKANAEKAKNANTGGFLGLGKLWDGAFGLANRFMDAIENSN